MKRYYVKPSLLSRLLEWFFTAVIVVWLIRLGLMYLRAHIATVIAVVVIALGIIIAYRVYNYKRHTRY